MKIILPLTRLLLLSTFFVFNVKIGHSKAIEPVNSNITSFDAMEEDINAFTINVTPTDQTCAGNGELTINIVNTELGASFVFEVYSSPGNTIIQTTTGIVSAGATLTHVEQALSAGQYFVIAYQTVVGGPAPGQNFDSSSTVTITDVSTALMFTLALTDNCTEKDVNVTVTSGFPVTYELRDGATVVRPAQASDVFASVPSGSYQVVVTDVCGASVSLGVTVSGAISTVYSMENSTSTISGFNILQDCDFIDHRDRLRLNGTSSIPAARFPINGTVTIQNPITGIDSIINFSWTTNADNSMLTAIPIYPGQTYNYTFAFTDACGNMESFTTPISGDPEFNIRSLPALCGSNFLEIASFERHFQPVTVTFITYPAGFDPSNFNTDFAVGTFTNTYATIPNAVLIGNGSSAGVPDGTYEIEVSSCGRSSRETITVTRTSSYSFRNQWNYPGCEEGEGSIKFFVVSPGSNFQADDFNRVIITAAPTDFVTNYGTLPFDATSNISSDGRFAMNSLPGGSYTFETVITCGDTVRGNMSVTGATPIDITVTPIFNCGSFIVSASITSNLRSELLYVQKFYSDSSKWGHPNTGVLYTPGPGSSFTSVNGSGIISNSSSPGLRTQSGTTSNILSSGLFRVVRQNVTTDNGGAGLINNCREIVETFNIPASGLALNNYYVAACVNGNNELVVDAIGVPPLNYTITERDGVPLGTPINNGINPIFTNLVPGIYKVEISDNCTNVRPFTISVTTLRIPFIRPDNLCEGETGTLSTQIPSFLNVEWTKGVGATTPIIATGNTLTFLPYTAATDVGVYNAIITNPSDPTSCIAQTISFTVQDPALPPQAGSGQTVTYSVGSGGTVSLFDFLSGTFDNYGQWTDLSATGELYNEILNAGDLPIGTYQFQYDVSGICTQSDDTIVTFIIRANLSAIEDSVVDVCPSGAATNIANVMDNDSLNGVLIVQTDYMVSTEVADPMNIISVNANGSVDIAAGSIQGTTYTLDYRVYDTATPSNFGIATLTVVVRDSVNPVITCRRDTVYLNASGNVAFDTSNVVTGFSDNCGVDSVWMSHDSAFCSNDSIMYTVYARDSSGNMDSCSNVIVVLDTINPEITCKRDTVYLDSTGNVAFDTSNIVTGFSDNCGVDSVWMSHDSAICSNDSIMYTVYARDSSGNMDSCSNVIVVLDTINPEITCKRDTVYLDSTGNVAFDTSNVVTGFSDNCGVDSVWMSHDSAICSNDSIMYTVYARDSSGNMDSCSNVIVVLDTINPEITCKRDTVYLDSTGNISFDTSDVVTGFSDNCGVDSIWMSHDSAICSNDSIMYTVYARDSSGNMDSCSNVIVVLDTINPVITCKRDTVYLDSTGNVAFDTSNIVTGFSDNCGVDSVWMSHDSAICSNDSIMYTVYARDSSGNMDSCSNVIVVLDTINPEITCKRDTVYLDSTGNISFDTSNIVTGFSDNCGVDSVWMSHDSAICSNDSIMYTVYARDSSGNMDSCSNVIVVLDTINPEITCKRDTVYLDSTGNISFDTSDVVTGFSDNCGVDSVWMSHDSAICSNDSIMYTVYARDSSGNMDSCSNVIVVLDTINPEITCKRDTVYLDSTGNVAFDTSNVVTGFSDNCGVDSVWMSHDSAICSNDSIMYTVYARDSSGNMDSCSNVIVVLDTINPEITCKRDTVYLDSTGNISFDTSDVVTGFSDNCGVDSVWMSHDSAICSNDSIMYTVYARDSSGNMDSCSNVIVVLDTINPEITCKRDTVYLDSTGNVAFDTSNVVTGFSDNCGVDSVWMSHDSAICSNDSIMYTVYARDSSGNMDSCSNVIVVLDTINPEITCKRDTVYLDSTGNISFDTSNVVTGFSDNCGVDSVWMSHDSAICSNDSIMYTVYARDSSGNMDSCSNVIVVLDTINPEITCKRDTVYLDSTGNVAFDTSNVVTGFSDNCGVDSVWMSHDSAICSNDSIMYTVYARDSSGNMDSCSNVIVVLDTINPEITCKRDTVYLDSTGNVAFDTSNVVTGFSDNCGVDSVWMSHDSAICSNDSIMYTVYARDSSGNMDSCSNVIVVLDTINPEITCKRDTVYLDSTGNVAFDTSNVVTGFSDNCGVDSVWMSHDSAICSNDSIMYTVYARDSSGNMDSCSNVIVVLDTINPEITCKRDTVYLDSTGNVAFDTSNIVTGFSDNCGVDSVWMSHDSAICSNDSIMYTVYARDNSGNMDSCSNVIVVLDTIRPDVVCKNASFILAKSNFIMIDTSDVMVSVMDNCGVDSVWLSQTVFTCADLGDNMVSVIARDSSGNIDSCIATVTIEVILTIDTIAVQMDQFNLGTICLTQSELIRGRYIPSILSIPRFGRINDFNDTCFNYTQTSTTKYLDTASIIICDDCGICDTTVLIFVPAPDPDTIFVLPIPSSNSDTCVRLESSFMAGHYVNTCDSTRTSSSGVPVTITGLCVTYPVPAPVFTGDTVCIIVCDTIRNVTICDTTLIVYLPDTTPPTVVCKNDTVYLNSFGRVTIDTSTVLDTVYDNTLVNAVWLSNDTFNCSNVGANFVTVYARDTNRNLDSCIATVTVLDTVAPMAICQNITIELDSINGKASIVALDLDGGSFDNCAIASMVVNQTSFDCSHLGTNSVTFTVTDIYGNISMCIATVTVEDNFTPITYCPGDKQIVLRNTTCSYTMPDYTGEASGWDNCLGNGVEITQWPLPGTEIILENMDTTVTITATDGSGNMSTCSFQLYARCVKELDIPQFISPDGNGQNDTWEIPGLADYPENVVKVFNRWGNLVFEKKGYFTGWNGSSNIDAGANRLMDNKMLPEGTYFYIIDLGTNDFEPYVGYMQIKR